MTSEIPGNLVMWAGLVGFFLPLAISLLVQSGWDSRAKSAAAFGCCLVASAGTAWFAGNFTGRDWVTCLLITFTLTVASYQGVWRPTGVAKALTDATTLKG